MDRVFALFRIFDIAFFVPGVVLVLGLHQAGLIQNPANQSSVLTSEGLLQIVLVLGGIYVLGLAVHALRELLELVLTPVFRRLRKLLPDFARRRDPGAGKAARGSWYLDLDPAGRRDLALYFWYLRATCWNVAVALALSLAVIAGHRLLRQSTAVQLLVGLLITLALLRLGYRFEAACRRAARSSG